MRQERFSPSTNVSGWKGRQDYLKGYPGAAMSDALNGGFAGGGASYVYEDSYKFFSTLNFQNNLSATGVPQTHRHLMIDITPGNQSAIWQGIFSFGIGMSGQPQVPPYSSSQWLSYGWYMGSNSGQGTRSTSSTPQIFPGYVNRVSSLQIMIYNYSSTDVLKPWWSRCYIGQGAWNGFSGYLESWGNLQQSSGNGSAPIDNFRSYDAYNNGSNGYQTCNLYGFGGLKP